jgi:Mg/Co/Ni transporter MgtE
MKKYLVIISEAGNNALLNEEFISKTSRKKYIQDMKALIENEQASFLGRAQNKNTAKIFQVFSLEEKMIYIEDKDATKVMHSLFDLDGQLREFEII